MMQAYPEFRGARVVKATATLTRRLDRSVPLDEVIETIKKNEFIVTRGDDALSCEREPFKLLVQGPNLTLSMPLADADVSKLLGAPTSLTTEQLALWFPKVKGATIARERFRLQLSYEASAPRAQYIAWQMVELNTKGSWRVEQWPEGYELKRRPDGGGGGTPDEYSVTLVDTNTSARISVHRNGKSVDLAYELQTEELQ